MHATTVSDGKGEWFNKYQTGGLGVLMKKVIKGVKIRSQPRQKLYDQPRHKGYNRLTVMLGENKITELKDDGIKREINR